MPQHYWGFWIIDFSYRVKPQTSQSLIFHMFWGLWPQKHELLKFLTEIRSKSKECWSFWLRSDLSQKLQHSFMYSSAVGWCMCRQAIFAVDGSHFSIVCGILARGRKRYVNLKSLKLQTTHSSLTLCGTIMYIMTCMCTSGRSGGLVKVRHARSEATRLVAANCT